MSTTLEACHIFALSFALVLAFSCVIPLALLLAFVALERAFLAFSFTCALAFAFSLAFAFALPLSFAFSDPADVHHIHVFGSEDLRPEVVQDDVLDLCVDGDRRTIQSKMFLKMAFCLIHQHGNFD